MKRALIVCPGRGSYDRSSLGSLQNRSPAAQAVIDACDARRTAVGRPTVSELDAAEAFSGQRHVAGENASLLTFACAMADLADLDTEAYEVVGVIGNSMGFYTALAASGALPLEDAIRLVDTLGNYQEGHVIGGQVLYPITDDAWLADPQALEAVERVLAAAGNAWWSIRLGAYAVLGGDEAACKYIMEHLPKIERGPRTFPTRLPLHSAFHTPLMNDTSDRALAELTDLAFQAPKVPLIDGIGRIHRPIWASPAELAAYTLDRQVVDTYDFSLSVQVALRHVGADVILALGPGNSLGAPLASVLVQDGWAASREDLDARQIRDPLLLSFGVTKQRERLVRGGS